MNQPPPIPSQEDSVQRDLALVDQAVAADQGASQQAHPFKRLHSLLRGRYPYAIGLAVLLATFGGVLGWRSVTLEYTSNVHIRVNPYKKRILTPTEETGVMRMLDAFINQQVDLINDPKVLKLAMENENWKTMRPGMDPQAQLDFRKALWVYPNHASKTITISFSDNDQHVAQIGSSAVALAYQRLHGERDVKADMVRMQVLEDRRGKLTNSINTLTGQINDLGKDYGTDDLAEQFAFQSAELQKIETALKETEFALAQAGSSASDTGGDPDAPIVGLTANQIAAKDTKMRNLLDDRDNLKLMIAHMEIRFGPEHKQLKANRARLELIGQQIEDYVRLYNESRETGDVSDPAIAAEQMGVAYLKKRIASLQELREKAREQTLKVGENHMGIQKLKAERKQFTDLLAETIRRIDVLNVETASGERINIGEASVPLEPSNASARQKYAAMGGMAGFSFGFGVFIVIGLFDRRLHSSTDVQLTMRGLRLLGILPYLPDDFDDPERATITGYCVHHIRAMLQLGSYGDQSETFAVTSPASGTGKTSLTLALGLSFAGAGSRTLLIDSDLAGGGLSRRLEAIIRRRIGQVLIRRGLLNESQLDEALRISQVTGKRLGESVVSLGFVTERQLEQALSLQDQAKVGLLDALDGEPIDDCIIPTEVDNLSILPVGGAKADDMSRVSPHDLQRILAEARQRYEVVLIDTGPVPGSVESAMVCAGADKVVMVVSRGESRTDAEHAIQFMHSVGSNVLGLVFNRADEPDFARSVYSSSMSKRSMPREAHPDTAQPGSTRYGPLAREVAGTTVSTNTAPSESGFFDDTINKGEND